MYVRGLNDFLTLRVVLRNANEFIETDGTLPTAPANGFLQGWQLVSTGYHLNNSERRMLAETYKSMPYSVTFDDVQYDSEFDVPAATLTTASIQQRIQNINQPVTALFVSFRWRNDLERTAGQANGTRGRDYWNWSGPFNAGGGNQGSIIQSLRVFSGNNDVLASIPTERLITHQHYRDFKGDANVALPGWSYSHDATQTNAVLGFISFDQIEQPTLVIQFQVPLTGVAFATVGAAANADIGIGAGAIGANLVCRVVAFTKVPIDQANFLLSRPFN